MQINTRIAWAISPVVNAVLFGAGTIVILTVPSLAAEAKFYLPLWIALSFLATPFLSWAIAPRLRSHLYRQGLRDP